MKNSILYINAKDFEDVVLKSDVPCDSLFYSDDCPHVMPSLLCLKGLLKVFRQNKVCENISST